MTHNNKKITEFSKLNRKNIFYEKWNWIYRNADQRKVKSGLAFYNRVLPTLGWLKNCMIDVGS